MKIIDSFKNEYCFLSNFYGGPVTLGWHTFRTVEHGFQAFKMTTKEDFAAIVSMRTPGMAKRAAHRRPMRKDWDQIKLDVMLALLRAKFSTPEFTRLLFSTGDAQLIEGNTWGDTYWGVCEGTGENHLGKLLMQVRTELSTKASQITLYHKDKPGVPAGTVIIPPHVLEAAATVYAHLQKQNGVTILHGLKLATPEDYKNV